MTVVLWLIPRADKMKFLIYLIIWFVMFDENVSLPSNYSDKPMARRDRNDLENKSTQTDFTDDEMEIEPQDHKEGSKIATTMPPVKTTSSSAAIVPEYASLTSDCTSDPDVITIPKYGMGLIALAIVILFLIILLLLLMLYKIQRKKYNESICEQLKPKTNENCKYTRQLSGNSGEIATTLTKDVNKESKLCLSRNDSRALLFKDVNSTVSINKTKIEDFNSNKPITNTEEKKNEQEQERTRKPTLSRVLRVHTKEPIISPEKMFEVCRGVLNKTKKSISVTDLDKMTEKKDIEETNDFEKCMSTPELDLDTYDVLPSSSPKKVVKENKNIKTPSGNDLSDDGIEDSIYDNPPPRNNRKRNVIVNADDNAESGLTDYVMPMSKDPGMYGNCKTVQMH